MLEVRNLAKTYGAVVAVQDASLALTPGEIHALVGANGSGKSTVIKVLSGVVRPDRGSIRWNGAVINVASPRDARRHGIATAFQDFSLIPTLSSVENCALATRQPAKVVARWLDEALDGLGARFDVWAPVETLTVNHRMVLEFVKALAQNPQVLILDEITAALDQEQVDCLFGRVREQMSRRPVAVLVVTHRLSEVLQYCDRVTVMRDGRTVSEHPVTELSRTRLAELIVGEAEGSGSMDHAGTAPPVGEPHVAELVQVSGRHRVSDVTLAVRRQEVVGVSGLQGQGQDELLSLAALFDHPKKGEIRIHRRAEGESEGGRRTIVPRVSQREIARTVGYVSGDRAHRGVFYRRSLTDNLFAQAYAMQGMFSWISLSRITRQTREILERLHIQGHPEQRIETLSGGNQQRVIFGRLLLNPFTFVVLDDPTLGVDIHSRRAIHQLIRAHREGGTLVYSSDNDELIELCHRVAVMFEGRIVEEFTDHELTTSTLGHAMLGRTVQGRETR
ncbi:MAG: sugar ABC transporter ATP-binding protein [Firmicutes bacterium]|nr:sugar ABC transporter ATP-binding protein [Bacillota bacterium]